MMATIYNWWGRVLSARQRSMQRSDPLTIAGIKFKLKRVDPLWPHGWWWGSDTKENNGKDKQ